MGFVRLGGKSAVCPSVVTPWIQECYSSENRWRFMKTGLKVCHSTLCPFEIFLLIAMGLSSDMLLRALWIYGPNILLIITGSVCWQKVSYYSIWFLLNEHIFKIDVVHGFLLICVIGGIFAKIRNIEKVILNVISTLTALMVLSRMLAETRFFPHQDLTSNCSVREVFFFIFQAQ